LSNLDPVEQEQMDLQRTIDFASYYSQPEGPPSTPGAEYNDFTPIDVDMVGSYTTPIIAHRQPTDSENAALYFEYLLNKTNHSGLFQYYDLSWAEYRQRKIDSGYFDRNKPDYIGPASVDYRATPDEFRRRRMHEVASMESFPDERPPDADISDYPDRSQEEVNVTNSRIVALKAEMDKLYAEISNYRLWHPNWETDAKYKEMKARKNRMEIQMDAFHGIFTRA
jgi:hypothetical protein